MKTFLLKHREGLAYVILLSLLLVIPVASMYFRLMFHQENAFYWSDIFEVWKVMVLLVVLFLLHNFLLAPLLLERKRPFIYLLLVGLLVVSFGVYCHYDHPRPRPMEKKKDLPAHRNPAIPLPPEFAERQGEAPPRPPKDGFQGDKSQFGKPLDRAGEPRRQRHLPPLVLGEQDVVSAMFLLFLFGMNLAIKLYFRTERGEKERESLERDNLEQQLNYLKYQINPHFLMNTLNNIHALVDISPEEAKDAIVELSRIMRHVLYESDRSLISVRQEVQFLKNYIRLMQIRYGEKVSITVDIPAHVPDQNIPPLICITFLENAFKHGVSYKQPSFIDLRMAFNDGQMRFQLRNSKHPGGQQEQGGVGLQNARRRLDLLYGNTYQLTTHETEDIYEMTLQLPLK